MYRLVILRDGLTVAPSRGYKTRALAEIALYDWVCDRWSYDAMEYTSPHEYPPGEVPFVWFNNSNNKGFSYSIEEVPSQDNPQPETAATPDILLTPGMCKIVARSLKISTGSVVFNRHAYEFLLEEGEIENNHNEADGHLEAIKVINKMVKDFEV